MSDIFKNAMSETMKESSMTEMKGVPKFFQNMPDSKDNADIPVAREDGNKTYVITKNEHLESSVHKKTGVPFERIAVELPNGEIKEGVFPRFDSAFDAQIPESLFEESDFKQFKECNRQLLEAIENDPDLKAKFSEEQIQQISDGVTDGTAPDGYTWHHDAECGKIQLVDSDIHYQTGHTGGRTIWGGGNESR